MLPLNAVLGSNFLGTTSLLLSLDGGELAGRLKLDSLIPVNGYKRCVDYQNGFGEPERGFQMPFLIACHMDPIRVVTKGANNNACYKLYRHAADLQTRQMR